MLTDGRMDDGRKVITIAHPEQSSGELTSLQAYVDSEGPDQTASVQSDLGLHCPLTESLDTTE